MWYAGTYRYTTFDLLVLVGTYLALLDGRPGVSHPQHLTSHRNGKHETSHLTTSSAPARTTKGRSQILTLARGSLAVIIGLQVILGLLSGIAGGRSTHRDGLATEDVIVNVAQAPDSVVERIYFGRSIPFVRQMVSDARRLKLSFLASPAGQVLGQKEGLDVGVWEGGTTSPVTPWQRLRNGQIVTVSARHFSDSQPQRLSVTECNANALNGDPNACQMRDVTTVVPRPDGDIKGRYRVTTGTIGDGTCGQGHACYIEVWSPHDSSLQSFAEVTF